GSSPLRGGGPMRAKRPRKHLWRSALGAAVLLLVGACTRGPPVPPTDGAAHECAPGLFREVTAEVGGNFAYRNGEEADPYAIMELVGGGLAALDFDGDGRLDLFVAGGGYYDQKQIKGHPCKLYRNVPGPGGVGFRLEDVTASAGLGKIDFYTHGAAVGDFDND